MKMVWTEANKRGDHDALQIVAALRKIAQSDDSFLAETILTATMCHMLRQGIGTRAVILSGIYNPSPVSSIAEPRLSELQ